MENLVLFIDLDGTLKTDISSLEPFEVPPITIESGEHSYTFGQRPHLFEFLDAASKKAKLVLSTAAGGRYARKVLKALNIDSYFSLIIAAEDYHKQFIFRTGTKYIFIDNDPKMVQQKVDALSGTMGMNQRVEKEIWVIDTYHGNKDDKTLLELKEEIEKL